MICSNVHTHPNSHGEVTLTSEKKESKRFFRGLPSARKQIVKFLCWRTV